MIILVTTFHLFRAPFSPRAQIPRRPTILALTAMLAIGSVIMKDLIKVNTNHAGLSKQNNQTQYGTQIQYDQLHSAHKKSKHIFWKCRKMREPRGLLRKSAW